MLTTVVTTSESFDALQPVANGLMDRFERAGKERPVVLYTDRDCCVAGAQSRLQQLFGAWRDLVIKLDTWHFMRRFAHGVTSESHPLYGTLMSCLSACIFEWDDGDVRLLERAKRQELEASGVQAPTDRAVRLAVSKKELARHCRRRTVGVTRTAANIEALLQELGDATDTLGTPLLKPGIVTIWEEQRRRLKCLQDPEGVTLYTRTGFLSKGGVKLPVYSCARGTTSLESFHLHLCRLIPGTKKNDPSA